MKRSFSMLMILPILFACVPSAAEPSDVNPENLPVQPVSPARPVPEVSTALPNGFVTLPPEASATLSDTPLFSPTTITFGDNGRSFVFHVGDSFLFDLGTDIYEWTVAIDNTDLVAIKTGEKVPEGAQGIFETLGLGTATLTAVGDPRCRKSIPPCAVPTKLFKIVMVVE